MSMASPTKIFGPGPDGEPGDPSRSDDRLVRSWALVLRRCGTVPLGARRGFARALEACANVARAGGGHGVEGEFAKEVVPKLVAAFSEAARIGAGTPAGVGISEREYGVSWEP